MAKKKYHYNHIWGDSVKSIVEAANEWAGRGFRLVHFARGTGSGDSHYWQGIIEKVEKVKDDKPK